MGTSTVSVWGSCHKIEHIQELQTLLRVLRSHGANLLIEASFARFLEERGGASATAPLPPLVYTPFECTHTSTEAPCPTHPKSDLAISFGGDGTLLSTVQHLVQEQTPVWAVNSGTLGFLTDVSVEEATQYIPRLLSGDYRIETRSLLGIRQGEHFLGHALNEVALQKRETGSMISVQVALDGVALAHYLADGLLLSTPTGTTAYSLSLGGPIIAPACRDFLLTPIAPHSLYIRPMVIPDHQQVELSVSSRSSTFSLVIDGAMQVLPCNTTLTIARSPRQARLIRLADKPFATTLSEKMQWGKDFR